MKCSTTEQEKGDHLIQVTV